MPISLHTLSVATLLLTLAGAVLTQSSKRPRDYGIRFGVLPTGSLNALTDMPGVRYKTNSLLPLDAPTS